jgi:hypothetical protein
MSRAALFLSMPASKFGFYSDQPVTPADPPEPLAPAPCLFDDLKVEWSTAALQKASYAYHTYNGFRTHMLSQVTGLGLDAAFEYDKDGNRLTKTAGPNTHTFGYTFENRLQSVKKNGATVRSYTFQGDSWMKRTATEVNDGVTTTRKLLYDGSDLLAEFDGYGELQAHYAVTGLDSALWTMRRSAGGTVPRQHHW